MKKIIFLIVFAFFCLTVKVQKPISHKTTGHLYPHKNIYLNMERATSIGLIIDARGIKTTKIDSTHSYVKDMVLKEWPSVYLFPEYNPRNTETPYLAFALSVNKFIEVRVLEPYWDKPRDYTYKEFKKMIYE